MACLAKILGRLRRIWAVAFRRRSRAPTAPARHLRFLTVLAVAAAVGVASVHFVRGPWVPDEDARRAGRLMLEGLRELGRMRREIGVPIDASLDPSGSGLIGVDYSDITTSLGDLAAKQTSLSPAFAGLVVKWLKEAGVRPGDRIAVTFSGSFPALNLAVLGAAEAMRLDAYVISSVGASMYGANIYGFTWLDMEKRLFDAGILHIRSRWASLGGIMDTHGGVFETGIVEGEAAIARTATPYLREGTPATVEHDALRRMDLYFEGGRPAAYVNVGGNVTAIGWINETHLLDNGLLRSFPSTDAPKRGLLFRMHERGVPVVHLLNIERLAAANDLPIAPRTLELQTDFAAARELHQRRLLLLLSAWLATAVVGTALRAIA
ncbi:MAG: poly-gamma-glutamate system protein [Phyllobacteriaceae bacterium]|nr:poly-gamma-glutamate system protein [Phyllobacteriaceae bacterium]